VSLPQVVFLGALAGLSIFLGLPIARLRHPRRRLQAFLSAGAAGVLLFLLVDILAKSFEQVGDALKDVGKAGALPFVVLLLALVLGLVLGLVGLAYYDERVQRRRTAAATPQQIAMTIAIAIGLHNLSEGLAIGQSAAAGKLAFATVLVIGFGLHNVTEGFGIAAPIAASGQGPASWRFLLGAGLLAGGPTFVGTLIGVRFANPVLFVLFLALAAGAIIHVLGELLNVGRRFAVPVLVAVGLLTGFLAGYGTDLMLTAGGA
jgi:ZIP family zinc transporter